MLDADLPRLAELFAENFHVSSRVDDRVSDAVVHQDLHGTIHSIALGDAAEAYFHPRGKNDSIVGGRDLHSRGVDQPQCGSDLRRVGKLFGRGFKFPQLAHGGEGDVECALGEAVKLDSARDDRGELPRHLP